MFAHLINVENAVLWWIFSWGLALHLWPLADLYQDILGHLPTGAQQKLDVSGY